MDACRAVANLEANTTEVVPAFVGPFRDQIQMVPPPRTLRPAGFTVFELRCDSWSRPIRIDSNCEYTTTFVLQAASADAVFTPALRFLDGAQRVISASATCRTGAPARVLALDRAARTLRLNR